MQKLLIFSTINKFSLLTFIFLFLSTIVNGQTESTPPVLQEQTKMPYFTHYSINGKKFTTENLQGKVTLVNFWYINCGPCMREFRYLNLLLDSIRQENFQIITFARNTTEEVNDFLNENSDRYALTRLVYHIPQPQFIILPSCSDIPEKQQSGCDYITDTLGIVAYPTTILIDKNGKVRLIKRGFPAINEDEDTNNPFKEMTVRAYFDLWRTEAEKLLRE